MLNINNSQVTKYRSRDLKYRLPLTSQPVAAVVLMLPLGINVRQEKSRTILYSILTLVTRRQNARLKLQTRDDSTAKYRDVLTI